MRFETLPSLKHNGDAVTISMLQSKADAGLVDIDVFLRNLGSEMLASVQIYKCHCCVHEENSWYAAIQLSFDEEECFQRWSNWWRKQEFLVVCDNSSNSSQNANLQERRECSFSVWWPSKLGFKWAEQVAYIVCLPSLIHVVNWFSSKCTICYFANLEISE